MTNPVQWAVAGLMFLWLAIDAGAESGSHSLNAILTSMTMGITEGRPTKQTEFPAVVRLASLDPVTREIASCSGTLIRQCVLTAAHCLDNPKLTARLAIAVGGEASRLEEQSIRMLWNEKNRSESEDIAIVKMQSALPHAYHSSILASKVVGIQDKATLDTVMEKDVAEIGIDTTIVGFAGKSLQKVGKMQLLGEGNLFLKTLPQHTMLSVPNPNTLEEGDSGGPLFIADTAGHPTLYGIAGSVGPAGAVHALVPRHRRWITDTLTELGCGEPRQRSPASLSELLSIPKGPN